MCLDYTCLPAHGGFTEHAVMFAVYVLKALYIVKESHEAFLMLVVKAIVNKTQQKSFPSEFNSKTFFAFGNWYSIFFDPPYNKSFIIHCVYFYFFQSWVLF